MCFSQTLLSSILVHRVGTDIQQACRYEKDFTSHKNQCQLVLFQDYPVKVIVEKLSISFIHNPHSSGQILKN